MANPNAEAAEAASHSADVRLSDISASTYKKSVVFATSDKSKRATQLEAHRMTVPTVQSAHMSSYAAGDNACTKSATEVEYLWLPSLKSEDKRRSRVEKYTHMEFTRNDNIYRLYTPRGAILIFLLLGTLLLMFAVALLCSSRHSFTQEIEYTDYGSEPITFKIEQDVKGPVYFGYKVSDFYVNHKRVAYESVPFRVTGAKCKMFDTFEKILDLRCIDNKNTLNGIDEWCAVKNTEPAFKLPAYPCGAISATIMTDNFAICRSSVQSVPATAKTGVDVEGCLPLSMKIPEDDYGFFHINRAASETADGFLWFDFSNFFFRSWVRMPYDSSFVKPYAVFNGTLEAGEYKLFVTNNLWPAKSWQARKYVVVTKPGFLGTSSPIFEIMVWVTAAVYLISGFVILLLHMRNYTCGVSPWRGIQVLDTTQENTTSQPAKIYKRDEPKPVENVPPTKLPCLCPCH